MPGLVEKSPLKGTPSVGFTRLFSGSPGIYARAIGTVSCYGRRNVLVTLTSIGPSSPSNGGNTWAL